MDILNAEVHTVQTVPLVLEGCRVMCLELVWWYELYCSTGD